MTETIKDKALNLLREEELRYNCKKFTPADKNEVARFEKHYGILLDANCKEWLLISNGSDAGQGGFYGIGHEKNSIQINYEVHPYWILAQWVPVAGDGFGNTYLVDCSDASTRGYIFFIDSYGDASKITYYVSSNFWMFMYMMLISNSNNDYDINECEDLWPFNKDFVLSIDPGIVKAPSELLPWNVN
jgi:cell wall assembly regulator SMI1